MVLILLLYFLLTFCAKLRIILTRTKYLMIKLCTKRQISFKILSTTHLGLHFDNSPYKIHVFVYIKLIFLSKSKQPSLSTFHFVTI
jgi:hypothetical protein